MRAAEVALDPVVPDREGAVIELRREAVYAVVRQKQIREEISAIRTRAAEIEQQASRVLARGEDLVARQILARGICTLKTRDALEAELAEARGRVAQLLTSIVRTEDRVWLARRQQEEHVRGVPHVSEHRDNRRGVGRSCESGA